MRKIHLGTIITPCAAGSAAIHVEGALAVEGRHLVAVGERAAVLGAMGQGAEVVDWGTALLLPGCIDTHTHLPQYAFAGIGDRTLLDWLAAYTFPQEGRFADPALARAQARSFFWECLRHGTTTVVGYVTSHAKATDVAFAEAERVGLRAWLGSVLMDRNAPDELLRPTEIAIAEARGLAERWHGKGRLAYVVTPRFAVSCTPELLGAAAELARERQLFLQTHISENPAEIALVEKLFPGSKGYADVYDATGCLGERTLLAHGVHLRSEEVDLCVERGCVVTHCPTSNRFLASGLMPLRRFRARGLRVSLGTDVAGGYSLSMFHEACEAMETSKLIWAQDNRFEPLNPFEALRLATLAGAEALGMADSIGSLEVGKEADFVVVRDELTLPGAASLADSHFSSPEQRLARVLYRGHPDMVVAAHVAGDLVWQA